MATQPCYPTKAPEIDDVLDVLGHYLRRELIDYFENQTDDQIASFDELFAHIDRRVPHETGDSLGLQLRHTHLPRLDAHGWVDYDTRREEIHYHGHDRVETWLTELHGVFTA